jgi:hypothetical protein
MKNTACRMVLCTILLLTVQNAVAQKYYPLRNGNSWIYRDYFCDTMHPCSSASHTYSTVRVIRDTVMPNGIAYSVLDTQDLTHGKYVRADSQYVFYYDETSEDTVFDLTADIGEQREIVGGYNGYLYSRVENIDTVYRNNTNNKMILRKYILDGPIAHALTLADSFGPMVFYSTGEPPGTNLQNRELEACVIDGVLWPDMRRVHVPDDKRSGAQYLDVSMSSQPGVLYVPLPAAMTGNFDLALYDITGKAVRHMVVSAPGVSLKTNGFRAGIYTVRLGKGTGQLAVKKIFIW